MQLLGAFPVYNRGGISYAYQRCIKEEEAHLHSSLKAYVTDGGRERQNQLFNRMVILSLEMRI